MDLYDNQVELVAFTRIYLAVFYSFVAVFYTTRIVFKQKSKTQKLIFTGERFSSTWWNHMSFRLFRVGIWAVCVIRLFFPITDQYLGMLSFSDTFSVIFIGNTLLTFGFLMTIVMHFKMGEQWRSGIETAGPKQLITNGFYRYSRHPMFLSIMLSQLGFFLALPSLFSLVCLVFGVTALYRQALSEEMRLSQAFPKQYKEYSATVSRWL